MSPASGAAVPADGLRRLLPRRKQMLWGLLGAFLASVLLVSIGYATTGIPSPNSFATAQATTLYYSDGKTVLARLGSTSRIDVKLAQVPKPVQYAVLAAEDRQFYSEPGISPTGILRALVTDIRGREISQGGSTITQQYVKNAYLNSDRTFTRKFKEIFIAVKLANSRSKKQILEDYLNTIYFGRYAYGIQAAAHAYFREDVSQLNAAQGAVLAATISSPSYYDPAVNKAASVSRWHYVIGGMVKQKWLPPSASTGLKYPAVKPPPKNTGSGCTGYRWFICQDVQLDLAKQGFDSARLSAGGYKVVTTIDKKAEDAAVSAEQDQGGAYIRHGIDQGRESALVSVQPGDGAIRALYGGHDACSNHPHPDQCTDLTGVAGLFGSGGYARPPGSSFKPYTLIAALKQGIGLNSTFHGPPSIQVNGSTISNSQNEQCGTCNLTEALAKSINTIFVPLAIKVGPDQVVQSAYDAGIPKSRKLAAVPTITLGVTDVAPVDQATGYATIAAQGVRAEPYLVARVESLRGDVVFKAKKKTSKVFDADVMADTTYAMTKVLDCGSGGTACGKALTGRPAAGKTGTNGGATGNKDAWFIGFTPQLATAVWFGNHDRNAQVTTNGGALYGGDLPAATWQEMMNAALLGDPVESFPPPAHVGSNKGDASPTPTKSKSASPTATPTPTLTSLTPTPTPTLTILPSDSGSPTPSATGSPSSSPSAGGTPGQPTPAPPRPGRRSH